MSRELADAKRKGKIGSGNLGTSKQGDSDFSKSAKFFKKLQEGGLAGRKRVATEDAARSTGIRVKL